MPESTYKIRRTIYKELIDTINNKAVTVIIGARHVGKTTICSKLKEGSGSNIEKEYKDGNLNPFVIHY
jgi:predicted AAA+ superfamily ATPase